jgi:hypothetical protein
VKTAFRSPLQSVTTLLALVMVMSLSFAAVSIAYAAGLHSQGPRQLDGAVMISAPVHASGFAALGI